MNTNIAITGSNIDTPRDLSSADEQLPETKNPLSEGPSRESDVPFVEDQKWTRWSDAIIEEARASAADLSQRGWFVVHPDDGLLLAVATRIEGGVTPEDFETPAVLRWNSRLDGRSYVLMEYPRLSRQSDR